MKKSMIAATVALVISSLLLLSDWSWRWMVVHGWSASKQAELMLSGHSRTEDEFIDYLIYTLDGCVIFSEHESESRAMAYCPKGVPSDKSKIGVLTHLIGAWYTTG